jgi:hypothetical protein
VILSVAEVSGHDSSGPIGLPRLELGYWLTGTIAGAERRLRP